MSKNLRKNRPKGKQINYEPWREDERAMGELVRDKKFASMADATRELVSLGLAAKRREEMGLSKLTTAEQIDAVYHDVQALLASVITISKHQEDALSSLDVLFKLNQDVLAESFGSSQMLLDKEGVLGNGAPARDTWMKHAVEVAHRILAESNQASQNSAQVIPIVRLRPGAVDSTEMVDEEEDEVEFDPPGVR